MEVTTEAAPSAATPAPEAPSFAEKEAAANQALDADLEKVWEKAQASDDEPDAPEAKGPERGPDGKFKSAAPKLPEPNLPAPDQKPPAQTENADQPKPPESVAETSAIDAPKWWSAELQAKFKALPPDVAKSIGEQALTDRQNISRLGTALQSLEPIGKVLNDFRQDFDAVGLPPAEGLRQLLQAQQKLANPTTRAEAFRFLLERFPTDLGQASDPYALPADPQITALQQELAELRSWRQEQERFGREQQEAQQRARYQASLREIEQVEKTLPEFVDLADDIALMIPGLKAANPNLSDIDVLKAAHEKAGWANPTVRAKWQKSAIEKQMKEAAEAAEKAKRANGLNVASKPRPATPGNLDDLLGSVWDKRTAA
jgi:hypothetical protein